jgi:hypothetical protein
MKPCVLGRLRTRAEAEAALVGWNASHSRCQTSKWAGVLGQQEVRHDDDVRDHENQDQEGDPVVAIRQRTLDRHTLPNQHAPWLRRTC